MDNVISVIDRGGRASVVALTRLLITAGLAFGCYAIAPDTDSVLTLRVLGQTIISGFLVVAIIKVITASRDTIALFGLLVWYALALGCLAFEIYLLIENNGRYWGLSITVFVIGAISYISAIILSEDLESNEQNT